MSRATKIFDNEIGQFIVGKVSEQLKMTKIELINEMDVQGFRLASDGQHQIVFYNEDKGYIYISQNKMYGANTEHANINQLILSHINTYISTPLAEREGKAIEMTVSEISQKLGYKIKIVENKNE